MRILLSTLLLVVPLVVPTEAAAQTSDALAYGNVHLTGTTFQLENSSAEFGAGVGIAFGYRAGSNLTVFAGWDTIAMNAGGAPGTYSLLHVDLGARYHFPSPGRNANPFVSGAITGTQITGEHFTYCYDGSCTTSEIDAGGFGLSVGGGLDRAISETVSFHTAFTATLGTLTNLEHDGIPHERDDIYGSARLTLGVSVLVGE